MSPSPGKVTADSPVLSSSSKRPPTHGRVAGALLTMSDKPYSVVHSLFPGLPPLILSGPPHTTAHRRLPGLKLNLTADVDELLRRLRDALSLRQLAHLTGIPLSTIADTLASPLALARAPMSRVCLLAAACGIAIVAAPVQPPIRPIRLSSASPTRTPPVT